MTSRALVVAAAVVLSAALINPADSAAQRQRWPGGNGGGGQQQGGGGDRARQRENGAGQRENGGGRRENGGGQRENGGGQRENGGGQRENGGGQRDDGGARPQGGGGRAEVRTAQPRGDRGDRGDGGQRQTPSEVRSIAPPPQQVPSTPAPQTRSEAGSPDDRRVVRRRYPTDADRANLEGGTVIRDANSGAVIRNPGDRGGVLRGDTSVRSGSRVAVPRVGPPPGYYNDKYDNYKHYSRGYSHYRHYGGRNVYVVPYGRTYVYYPRYYYHPYAFGYGPAGHGHVYFDLHYNSYVWHPYSVYRYDTYGSYGYPVGELRLKVHPRDAQVFIDGYYAGRVDDFDGVFQSLKLEEGEYQVEVVLPGYEPLAFNVRIFPGEKTTYEGDLIRELIRELP
jgi:hypothetical protein